MENGKSIKKVINGALLIFAFLVAINVLTGVKHDKQGNVLVPVQGGTVDCRLIPCR